MELKNEDYEKYIKRAKESFPYFLEFVFPLSFPENLIVKAPHTFKWGKRVQENKRTATLSARKHLKSITMYGYLMWRLLRLEDDTREEWDYMSYTSPMSSYHTENIKLLIQYNPLYKGIKDLTSGKTQIDYTWNGKNRFIIQPTGILTFNRGRHPYGVIADDILQDPTSEMNFLIIDKITRVFMEQVMSLPKEGGEVHLVGTAQHQQDLFFKLEKNPSWNWAMYKAMVNEKEKKTLWPELFSFDRLIEIRTNEIGEKAFNKEYQCSPVWSEEAYFRRDELLSVVSADNPETGEKGLKTEKRPASQWKEGEIIAAIDIGKKSHPSHISIFKYRFGHFTLLYQEFLDGWDYTKQIEHLKALKEFYLIDEIRYDNTRGEFEPFVEQGIIDSRFWIPIVFSRSANFKMASNFSKIVNNKQITLLNHQRMIDSILSVNNDLKAPETSIGHGDAFWSVAMALYQAKESGGYIA